MPIRDDGVPTTPGWYWIQDELAGPELTSVFRVSGRLLARGSITEWDVRHTRPGTRWQRVKPPDEDAPNWPECEHEWIDATNEVVENAEMCRKCMSLRPTGDDGTIIRLV